MDTPFTAAWPRGARGAPALGSRTMNLLRRLVALGRSLLSTLKRQAKRIALAVAALLLLLGGVVLYRHQAARGPTLVTVDPQRIYQTIDGWAVYTRYWEDDKKNDRFDRSFEPHTERVSNYLVDELGINAVRVEIWSGLENPTDHFSEHYQGKTSYRDYANFRYEKINDNADPKSVNPAGFQLSKFDHRMKSMVLPLKRALDRRGEKLFINVCYVDFHWKAENREGTLSHADEPDEYAEFVLFFFERLRDEYGIVPDAFEVILEPENTVGWRGHEIGVALVAVAKRLEQRGFTPRFVAPSNTSMQNAIRYYDEMIKVPGALERLDTFSYHRYHLERTSYVEEIWERAKRHGKKTAMLEKVGAGIDELFEDLTVGHVSGWQQWAAAGRYEDPGHGSYYTVVDNRDPAAPRVLPAPTSLLLSQVFRYVRRGARRIGAESDNHDKKVVAFKNPSGGTVVVVRAESAGGNVSIAGLPPGTYGRRFVDQHSKIKDLLKVTVARDKPLVTEIPAAGALTVYALSP